VAVQRNRRHDGQPVRREQEVAGDLVVHQPVEIEAVIGPHQDPPRAIHPNECRLVRHAVEGVVEELQPEVLLDRESPA
jgi:hypothetical protein